MGDLIGCIGFTDSTLSAPCPETPTCEIRVMRDGTWGTWKKACDGHADGAVEILGNTVGYDIERRSLCPDCPGVLAEKARGLGLDVTVSTSEPAVNGPYTTDPFRCPHGVTYWIEPTGEQIAYWAKEGVR